jgi:predicted nucleic acid-binding protein
MRLYLDNNVMIRPFDDQRQGRVWIETLAFSLVLSMIENGEAELIVSEVHRLENSAAPDVFRRNWVDRVLNLAAINAPVSELMKKRAKELELMGLTPLDALHVSGAELSKADYFLTCDDRLAKRYKGKMPVMSPPQFISTLG